MSSRPSPFFEGAHAEGSRMGWDNGSVRPVALEQLGQTYRRYRLADPHAEEAMAASLRRWGQLAPVVACARGASVSWPRVLRPCGTCVAC